MFAFYQNVVEQKKYNHKNVMGLNFHVLWWLIQCIIPSSEKLDKNKIFFHLGGYNIYALQLIQFPFSVWGIKNDRGTHDAKVVPEET